MPLVGPPPDQRHLVREGSQNAGAGPAVTAGLTVTTPAAHEWVSAHVFYSDDLDPLLVEAVAPLVRELTDRALIDGFFFLRYWDGGYHLRLRCRPSRGSWSIVELHLTDRITRFLHDRPAGHEVDPQDYAAYAAELARQERVSDYQRRPYRTNTIVFLPYRREHERYGYGESMAAVERHFERSSEIVLSWLVAGLPPAERTTAALAMTLLAWFCARAGAGPDGAAGAGAGPDAAPVGRMMVRSGEPGSPDDRERYDRQREPLHRLATKMRALAARSGDLPGTGGLLSWARSVRSLHDTLAGTLDRSGDRTPSGVLDICAHLACNRLGVSSDEERHLRYLAARTVAELDQDASIGMGGDRV